MIFLSNILRYFLLYNIPFPHVRECRDAKSNDLFFKKLKLIIDSCSVYVRKSLLIGHNYNITNSSSRSFSISLEAYT